MESKEEARRIASQAVLSVGEDYLRGADAVSFETLFGLDEYINASTVFSYVGVGLEPDTTVIINHAIKSGKRAAVPKITGSGEMKAVFITSTDELSPGAYGLMEPEDTGEEAVLCDTDIIILPAAAFSEKLDRLGRGGGYYDRFLVSSRGIKIGIEREKLLLHELPTEDHDVSADILITEERIRSRG